MKGWEKPDSEELAFWRHTQYVETAADLIISTKPCFVFDWEMEPLVAGASDCFIYDGQSASDTLRASLFTVLGDRMCEAFWPPLYFSKGLYVDVDTNVFMFRVHFFVDPER